MPSLMHKNTSIIFYKSRYKKMCNYTACVDSIFLVYIIPIELENRFFMTQHFCTYAYMYIAR